MKYLVILLLAAVWMVEGNPMTLLDNDNYLAHDSHDQIHGGNPDLLTDYKNLERAVRTVDEKLNHNLQGHENKNEQDLDSSKRKHHAAGVISKGIEHGRKGLQKITNAIKAPLGR